MTTKNIDPITLEVMRNAFYSISEEMNAALIRASYSTNIKDRRDASCAIYTATGDIVVVAQSEMGTPLHMGTMHSAVRTALDEYPFDELSPGDAVAMNTPYPGGPGHLNDLCLISPIFHEGRLVALTANQAHHVDMGGFAPGSMPFGVTEIFQEGLQIPPVRLFRGGELDRDLWNLISQNVRTQVEVRGDLFAQLAANSVGGRHIVQLMERFGTSTVEEYLEEMLNYSERRMRAALALIPVGTYKAEDVVEGDGIVDKDYVIRVTIEAKGDSIKCDFTETDPSALGPLNCRWPSVAACVYYVLKAVLDPELPPNAGLYRPIEIEVRDGTLLSAVYPTAVCNANIITTQRIVDALISALSQAVPDRVAAASSGTMNLLNIGGMNPRTGIYYNYVETYAGGQGAMHNQDGMDAVQNHMTNTRNGPVESIEQTYPLLVESYTLMPDSEGAGEHRGGVGLRRSFRVLGDQIRVTLSSDRAKYAPWGLFGGQPASKSRCVVNGPDESRRTLPSKVTTDIGHDLVLETTTPGGGGWGDPRKRDANAVLRDVIAGLVTPGRAHDVYGVAVDVEAMTIDDRETARLRSGA